MEKVIINANVVLENGIIWDGYIRINDDTITSFGQLCDGKDFGNAEVIDAKGAYVGPGFVDIHNHGFQDKSACFNGVEAAEHFLKYGTTTLLPTMQYKLTIDKMVEAIRAAKKAMKETNIIKGINFEGPYINVKYGAHAHINPWGGPIEEADFKTLVDEAGDAAVIWTIAPEREGILPFVEYARKVKPDVLFSIGHSEATPKQIRALGKYRPGLQTHSMCATGQEDAPGGTRSAGPDEYSFKETDVFCELISDSRAIHVNPEMQQLLVHNKGVEKIVLITDSTCSLNPSPEEFKHIDDLNFDDRGGLSGSRLTMNKACRNIMTHTNCGIVQAFVMASLNPAKVIGLDNEIGSIELGKKADLVFVNDRFDVKGVMLAGKVIKI